MKYFSKLLDLQFLIPVVVASVVGVYLWNNFAAPFVSAKVGKDLTA